MPSSGGVSRLPPHSCRVFWSIASKASATGAANSINLDSADLVLVSDGASGVLDNLSLTPNVDINADGISDILVGAANADVVSNGINTAAGKVYVTDRQSKPRTTVISDP